MNEPHFDDEGRPEPPFLADESATLLGFLDYQRTTLSWKTSSLTTEQLRSPLQPTRLTLAGLLTHLAWVEDFWFTVTAAAAEPAEPWRDLDWSADDDAEFTIADTMQADELQSLWLVNVERSRSIVQGLLEEHGDGAMSVEFDAWGGRERVSLRWILTHMIEEYARHNGHADLLREAIDGATGE